MQINAIIGQQRLVKKRGVNNEGFVDAARSVTALHLMAIVKVCH